MVISTLDSRIKTRALQLAQNKNKSRAKRIWHSHTMDVFRRKRWSHLGVKVVQGGLAVTSVLVPPLAPVTGFISAGASAAQQAGLRAHAKYKSGADGASNAQFLKYALKSLDVDY